MKLGNLSLFHTPGEQAFASVRVGRHHETWPLKSSGFRNLLSHQFYRSVGKVPNSQALQAALAVLAGRARFDGEEHLVFVRVAEHEGKTFVDLCDREWRAVEVTAEGWSVVAKPPVRFRRARGMLPLPEPAPGGKIQDIWTFVNIKSGGDRLLFLAWLVAALRAHGPYPILVLNGEHGTAKTTAEKVARQLIDPSEAPLRTTPRDERDLMIAARNSHVIGFDNLSWLPTWLADALCRLATGGGLATRELYTDDEEVIFDAQRPVLLNGIEELPTRGDFVDRQIALHLPEIHETKRKTEESFWADFGFAHPRILGALFDAVSAALRAYPSVKFRRLPRMADFAKWPVLLNRGWGSSEEVLCGPIRRTVQKQTK